MGEHRRKADGRARVGGMLLGGGEPLDVAHLERDYDGEGEPDARVRSS